jgi:hypothetical protein
VISKPLPVPLPAPRLKKRERARARGMGTDVLFGCGFAVLCSTFDIPCSIFGICLSLFFPNPEPRFRFYLSFV